MKLWKLGELNVQEWDYKNLEPDFAAEKQIGLTQNMEGLQFMTRKLIEYYKEWKLTLNKGGGKKSIGSL